MSSIPHSTRTRKSKIEIVAGSAEPGAPIFVTVLCDGKQSDYWAERIPAAFGLGVRFRKIWDGRTRDFAGDQYDVNLDLLRSAHSCECLGFLRHGYCRHVDAALHLLDAGRLSESPRPEHIEERPCKQAQPHAWCEHCHDDPGVYCEHCSL